MRRKNGRRQARGGQASVLDSGLGYDFDYLPSKVTWAGSGMGLSPAFGINTLYSGDIDLARYKEIVKEKVGKARALFTRGIFFVVPSLNENEATFDTGHEIRGKGAFGHTFGLGVAQGSFTKKHSQILEEQLAKLARRVGVEQRCLGSGLSFLDLQRYDGSVREEGLQTKAEAQSVLDRVRATGDVVKAPISSVAKIGTGAGDGVVIDEPEADNVFPMSH